MKSKLLVLSGISLLFSCADHGLDIQKDVYVVGSTSVPDPQGSAAFWKNGVLTRLSAGYYASAISVSGSHIYMAGANNSGVMYWEDTTSHVIPNWPNTSVGAYAIAVSGSDVYLAGSEGESYPNENDSAVYWKNGIKTILASSNRSAKLVGIAVSGSDVYAAGYFEDYYGLIPAYWKNGVEKDLPGTAAFPTGFALSGSDVYVSGWMIPIDNPGHSIGCYWKNGVLTMLATPEYCSSEANAITVSGSDVYAAGTLLNFVNNGNTYSVVYWKNGVMTQLSDGYTDAAGTSLVVSGGDVYVAGWVTNSNYESHALYWKNGIPTDLGLGWAMGIFVK